MKLGYADWSEKLDKWRLREYIPCIKKEKKFWPPHQIMTKKIKPCPFNINFKFYTPLKKIDQNDFVQPAPPKKKAKTNFNLSLVNHNSELSDILLYTKFT